MRTPSSASPRRTPAYRQLALDTPDSSSAEEATWSDLGLDTPHPLLAAEETCSDLALGTPHPLLVEGGSLALYSETPLGSLVAVEATCSDHGLGRRGWRVVGAATCSVRAGVGSRWVSPARAAGASSRVGKLARPFAAAAARGTLGIAGVGISDR